MRPVGGSYQLPATVPIAARTSVSEHLEHALYFTIQGAFARGENGESHFFHAAVGGTAFFMAEAGEDRNREEAFQVMSGCIAFAGRLRLDSVFSNVDDRTASFQEARRRGF